MEKKKENTIVWSIDKDIPHTKIRIKLNSMELPFYVRKLYNDDRATIELNFSKNKFYDCPKHTFFVMPIQKIGHNLDIDGFVELARMMRNAKEKS